jgi:prepilin-type N-terminal cleavage/methylation domain-containing protein
MQNLIRKRKSNCGFTYVELMLVITLIALLATGLVLIYRPSSLNSRARDNDRLSDLSAIERAVNEFYIDNEYYPDITVEDLSTYLHPFPVDPLNDADYFYSYSTDGSTYEINVRLEYLIEKMTSDNGNEDNRYELGNKLDLLPE